MNILDHNFPEGERRKLEAAGFPCRKIGRDIGRANWQDWEHIRPYLMHLERPTFFTSDGGFARSSFRSSAYCLVILDVLPDRRAEYTRRLLRHPQFRTKAQRMGQILRVSSVGVRIVQDDGLPLELPWPTNPRKRR